MDGRVYISNSFFFERYLGWEGLLVEASPVNFGTLLTTRPRAYRLETALCADVSTTSFSGHGCCGRGDGNGTDSLGYPADTYTVRCTPVGPVLRHMQTAHIDFFSLDVEGAEMEVLQGMDWNISVSVFLIESVTDAIRVSRKPAARTTNRSDPTAPLSTLERQLCVPATRRNCSSARAI